MADSTADWFNQAIAGAQSGSSLASPSVTAAGLTSSPDPLLSPVYLPRSRPNPNTSRFEGKPVPGAEGGLDIRSVTDETTVGDAYDEFHRMSSAARKAFAQKLERAGLLEPGSYTYQDLAAAWRSYVDYAAEMYAATGKKVSPQQMVNMDASILGDQGSADDFDPRDVDRNTTTVNDTSVSLIHKQDARAILRNAFQSELGRDPTRRETRAFYRAMREAQRENPTHTTGTRSSKTVINRKRNGNSRSNTTSSDNTVTQQSFDEGSFTANYMDDRFDNEMDARRTATDYYGALIDLARGDL